MSNTDSLQDISAYTTFKLPAKAVSLVRISSAEEARMAVLDASRQKLPIVILGGGSNTIFQKEHIEGVVIKNEILGMKIISENDTSALVQIGAGVPWDDAVNFAVENDLSGIEAMAKIPGTTGATPIQNVGAYGQEIKDTLEELEALNMETGEIEIFLNEDCYFSYRDSIFKHEAKGKYLITSVTLRLHKTPPSVPHYPGVQEYFSKEGITSPTLQDIAKAIAAIRSSKLPDPEHIASVGSFFKNPIVEASVYEKIKAEYPNVKAFPVDEKYKIPAGWLIDTLGYKGKIVGNLEFYPNNALVIVNKGGATFTELNALIHDVISNVEKHFGIMLEPEPVFI